MKDMIFLIGYLEIGARYLLYFTEVIEKFLENWDVIKQPSYFRVFFDDIRQLADIPCMSFSPLRVANSCSHFDISPFAKLSIISLRNDISSIRPMRSRSI